MGTVSEYRMGRLASSAVGTPGVNPAAGAIADAVGEVADVLIQRQMALDKAQYTNAYYDFLEQDEINRTRLQRDNFNSPEGFDAQYKRQSLELATSFKERLPERMRDKFSTLVNKRHTQVTGSNIKWMFSQQNRLGLNRVAEGANQYALSATSFVDADQFLERTQQFNEQFEEVYAPLIDPESAENAKKTAVRNAITMFSSAMMDNNNGGALQLVDDLDRNERFREMVIESFGAEGFKRLKGQAEKQVVNLISEQAFDMLQQADEDTQKKVMQLFETPQGVAVTEAESSVMQTSNALEHLKTDPNAKLYDEQISILEEQLRQQQLIAEIARQRNNHTVIQDPQVYHDLQNKVSAAIIDFDTKEERTELQGRVAQDQLKTIDAGNRRGFQFGGFVGMLTKDPLKSSKASKTYSEYLTSLYALKGEILAHRAAGHITDSDASKLINKFVAPLSSLSQYDKIKAGDNDFVEAYNAFDDYAKNVTIPGVSGETARRMRDVFRNRMVDEFVLRRAQVMESVRKSGVDFPEDQVPLRQLVEDVMKKFQNAFIPASYGVLKPGKDYVQENGVPVKFMGINRSTGSMVLKTPETLKESLNNI